jgi:hypothetical protein
MATTTYDPLKDALANTQQQPGIFSAAMGAPAASTATTTAAPAPAPAPAPSVGIVGAQSAQLQNPTEWKVTDDQTVEGRINRIINADSPFMQQARSRSMEQANARGLANTSMAITAGESAAYDAALPIAQTDAATFAKAAGYNADQTNQFAVTNVNAENQFKLQDKQVQGEKDLALINRETQVQLTNLDAANKAAAAQVQAQNQRILETNAQAAEAFQTAMSAINNIQNNNQMDSATKTEAISQVWRDVQTQLKVMGAVAGLDLTSQLNFSNYPGFDSNGTYVGFGGTGAGSDLIGAGFGYGGYSGGGGASAGAGAGAGGGGGGSGGGGAMITPSGIPAVGTASNGQPLPAYGPDGQFINWNRQMQAIDGSWGNMKHAYEVAVRNARQYGSWAMGRSGVPTPEEWLASQLGGYGGSTEGNEDGAPGSGAAGIGSSAGDSAGMSA